MTDIYIKVVLIYVFGSQQNILYGCYGRAETS